MEPDDTSSEFEELFWMIPSNFWEILKGFEQVPNFTRVS